MSLENVSIFQKLFKPTRYKNLMFNKKCQKCNKKIERGYEYCPYCGYNLKRERDEDEFGFLGKNDNPNLDFQKMGFGMPFGFNGIFDSLTKQVEKQFRKLDKEIGKDIDERKRSMPNVKSRGFSVSISTATGKKPEIRIQGFGPEFQQLNGELKIDGKKEEKQPKIKNRISEEKMREIAKLPREEAETNVRRMNDRVVYEIELPNVKSIKDVVINKLENSIEIKAFAKDKVYFKLLPVKLPILGYGLKEEKLILELKTR